MDVNDAIEQTIETTTHGRYLMPMPSTSRGAPALVGFHGYGESAESQLERLTATPAALDWLVVSIQGLHRFYDRRTNQVVASWMTRQNRELAMADNQAYVSAVIEQVNRGWGFPFLVFAGFSQGVAMAFRAAAASNRRVAGVVAVGGDIPPEIEAPALAKVGSVLLCRGIRDEWYSPAKFQDDLRRLREANVRVQPLEIDGGHEWSAEVNTAADGFLRGLRA